MQEEFLSLVAEERERGCTVFISSHELDEVERVCDRVGIVREGRLIAVERIHDLLGRARRSATVELADSDDLAQELRVLPSVSDLLAVDGKLVFKVAGDLDPVLNAIAAHHIIDLELTHPTLEEVFLTYYGEEQG
jgi:ABC-2 type transport system ATP-binding protein